MCRWLSRQRWPWGKLFQIKLGRFLQISNGLLEILALADNADFRAFGNIPSFFPVYHGGVGLNRYN